MEREKKRRMIFGPIGGLCEACIMQPFDTIKVRRQSNQYIGLVPTIKQHGITNLYRGLTPFMGQMFVKYGLRFKYTHTGFINHRITVRKSPQLS